MKLGRTLGVVLLGAAALALWVPALRGRRGPALPARSRTAQGEAPLARVERAPFGPGAGGGGSEALRELERDAPERPQRALADLQAPRAPVGADDAWDELALRWTRRLARERAGTADATERERARATERVRASATEDVR